MEKYNNGEKVWYFWFDDDDDDDGDDDDDDDDIDDDYDNDDDDDDDDDDHDHDHDDHDDNDEVQIFLSDHSNLIWTHTISWITQNIQRINYLLFIRRTEYSQQAFTDTSGCFVTSDQRMWAIIHDDDNVI